MNLAIGRPSAPSRAAARADGRRRPGRRRTRGALLALLFGLLSGPAAASAAPAPPSWEYSPYRLRVWVSQAPSTWLNSQTELAIRRALAQRAEIEAGAAWNLVLAPPPPQLSAAIFLHLGTLSADDIARAAPAALQDDKILLLSVEATAREYVLRARELDCHTRTWGPVVESRERHPGLLADRAYATIVRAFAPLARIEMADAKTALVRVRAGGLIVDPRWPASIGRGDILQPAVRVNDRYGNPIPARTGELPWTLLQVTGASNESPSLLRCHVYSGFRSPLPARPSARRELYALSVRPAWPSTRVILEGRATRKQESSQRLAGLEVYARDPAAGIATPGRDPPAPPKKQPESLQFLGTTDWRGTLDVRPGPAPLRILYVKCGDHLLARLPLVPGLAPQQIAEVPDASARIRAEGCFEGFQGQLTELVAQRQILAARIRQRIRQGKLEEAERLLGEFRSLRAPSDLLAALEQQLHRGREPPTAALRAWLDKRYAETRAATSKYLDPDLGIQLQRELAQARQKLTGQ